MYNGHPQNIHKRKGKQLYRIQWRDVIYRVHRERTLSMQAKSNAILIGGVHLKRVLSPRCAPVVGHTLEPTKQSSRTNRSPWVCVQPLFSIGIILPCRFRLNAENKTYQFGDRTGLHLLKDFLPVRFNCANTEIEFLGDLFVRQPGHEQFQNSLFMQLQTRQSLIDCNLFSRRFTL